jgi:hypothetical protein
MQYPIHKIIAFVNISYPVRARLGIVVVIAVILTTSLRQLHSAIMHSHVPPQMSYVSRYEQRFSKVKSFLRPAQIVAYEDDFTMSPEKYNAFVLAQYSLAPAILAIQHSRCGHLSDKTPGLPFGCG